MVMTRVEVRAILVDPDHWLIDCSHCGTVSVATAQVDIDLICLDHLDGHGVDTRLYRSQHP